MKKLFPLIFILCLFLTTQSTSQFSYGDYEEPSVPSMFYIYKGEPIEFPLQSYNADVDIVGNIANVKLIQTFINVSGQKIDAKYRFPGSTQAAVNGMTMKIKDRVIYAKIQEKQQARETFETAKKEGKRASLLSQEKPNIFTTEVANIYAGDTIQVIVEYSEIIEYKDYTYSFVLPTKIGGRYQGYNEKTGTKDGYDIYQNPHATETIDFDINVSISSIFDVAKVKCKTHTISTEQEGNKTFVTMNTPSALDRDFILQYEMVSKKVESGLLIHEGEEENFFLLMLQAPKRVSAEEILPREYVFVVDVSGSMNGKPLETAIHLFGNLLEKTNEKDLFNVIKFAGGNKVLFSKAEPATMENLQKGFDFLADESGGGGTELLEALKKAMTLPKLEKYSRSVILITDGFISADLEVIEYLSQNLDKGNIFPFGIGESVNRYVIEGLANISMSEPFIITDMEDADKEADKFKEYIDSPVMTDIKIDFEGLDVYDIIPEKIPDVYAQRPIIISGKFRGAPEGIVYVNGQNGKQEMKTYFEVERFAEEDTSQVLKYLWARRKLQTLQDIPGEYSFESADKNKAAIIDLGLKYHLMTNHTSFVAVDTEVGKNLVSSENDSQTISKKNNIINEFDKNQKFVFYNKSAIIPAEPEPDEFVAVEPTEYKSFAYMDVMSRAAADGGDGSDLGGFASNIDFDSPVEDEIPSEIESQYEYQMFPVKDGELDTLYRDGDTVNIDMLYNQRNFYTIFRDHESLKQLDSLFNLYSNYVSIDEGRIVSIEVVIDQNKVFSAVKLPVLAELKPSFKRTFIQQAIKIIAANLTEVEGNRVYVIEVPLTPRRLIKLDGKIYKTELKENIWQENTDSMNIIPDSTKYTLFYEAWDANKELVDKGRLDNITNSSNPFVQNSNGKIEIFDGGYCLYYYSFYKTIFLKNAFLNEKQKYYIRLKGVVTK